MSRHIALAMFVLMVGMVLAIPTAVVVILALLVPIDVGVGINPVGLIVLVTAPAVAAAALTRLTGSFLSRQSNPDMDAGPAVLGCAAGSLSGWALATAIGAYEGMTLFATLAIGPATGALAGSLVPIRVSPLTVGAIVLVLGIIALVILGGVF